MADTVKTDAEKYLGRTIDFKGQEADNDFGNHLQCRKKLKNCKTKEEAERLETDRQRASDLNRILPYYGVGKIGESYLFDYSCKLAYVGMRIYEHNLSQWENLAGSNYCLGYWEISNNGNSI